MIATFKYILLTMKHKWFVLKAGLRIGCPISRLLLHDMSKFLPSELPHYGRQFFGDAKDPNGFAICWLKHQNRNDHHWEHWISRTGHIRTTEKYSLSFPLDMPKDAVLEMCADWLGASRAYEKKWPESPIKWVWYRDNIDLIKVTEPTREIIIDTINAYFRKD